MTTDTDALECKECDVGDTVKIFNREPEDDSNTSVIEQGPAKADPHRRVADAIARIREGFSEWGPLEQRATRFAWTTLGRIYEACPMIVGGTLERGALVEEVRKVAGVGKSNRWDPFKRSAEELYLTLLFGLKEQRATKSQWKDALEAAAKAGVERAETAFLDWISKAGGIDGARKSLRGDEETDNVKRLVALGKDVEPLADNLPQITLPLALYEEVLPADYGLMLVKKVDDSTGSDAKAAQLIAMINNEPLIIRAMEHLRGTMQREDKKKERTVLQELDAKEKARRKRLRAGWMKQPKRLRSSTLEEYIREHPGEGYDDIAA